MGIMKDRLPIKLGDDSNASDLTDLGGLQYLVTDGCYVLPDDVWQNTIDFWDWADTDEVGRDWIVIEVDGHRIFMFSTAYGDGTYDAHFLPKDPSGTSFWNTGSVDVDSGTIALIPTAYADDDLINEILKNRQGIVTEIDGDFKVKRRGVVNLGHTCRLCIDTGGEVD